MNFNLIKFKKKNIKKLILLNETKLYFDTVGNMLYYHAW